MTTTVIVPRINRPITDKLFSDITNSEWRYEQNIVGEYVITFVDDLPATMPAAIQDRCRLLPAEELVIGQLYAIFDKAKVGPLTSDDITQAISGLIQLQLRNFDS